MKWILIYFVWNHGIALPIFAPFIFNSKEDCIEFSKNLYGNKTRYALEGQAECRPSPTLSKAEYQ